MASSSLLRDALGLAGSVLPYSLKFWEWSPEPDVWSSDRCENLKGRVAIVTGGTGGVGLETCYELVRHGAHVFLGARSRQKFEVAKREIQRKLSIAQPPSSLEGGGGASDDEVMVFGRIEFLLCDVTTMAGAQTAADAFLARSDVKALHMFIACAGRGSGREPVNEDGVEPFMATNCVNHVVMLRTLLPLMIDSARGQPVSSRIVLVSSVAHHWSSMPRPFGVPVTYRSWEDVNDARRSESGLYAQSKLAQILIVKRLTLELRRLASEGRAVNLRCLAIHPGEINNDFVQRHFVHSANRLGLLSIVGKVRPLLHLFLLNAREGARTCLYAATARQIDKKTRQHDVYFTYPCQTWQPSRRACDAALGQRCWTLVNGSIDKRLGSSTWLDV